MLSTSFVFDIIMVSENGSDINTCLTVSLPPSCLFPTFVWLYAGMFQVSLANKLELAAWINTLNSEVLEPHTSHVLCERWLSNNNIYLQRLYFGTILIEGLIKHHRNRKRSIKCTYILINDNNKSHSSWKYKGKHILTMI